MPTKFYTRSSKLNIFQDTFMASILEKKKKGSYIISVANFNINSMITSLELKIQKILVTSSLIQLF